MGGKMVKNQRSKPEMMEDIFSTMSMSKWLNGARLRICQILLTLHLLSRASVFIIPILILGGIDFAILEDRKFKSGPAGKIPQQGPRPDHIRNPNYDPKSIDVDGLVLLGDRQLSFLDTWGPAERWNCDESCFIPNRILWRCAFTWTKRKSASRRYGL